MDYHGDLGVDWFGHAEVTLSIMNKKHQLVIGLGQTGLSCVRHLLSAGFSVAAMDTRAEPPELAAFKQAYPDVPLYLGGLDPAGLDQAARVIVSPGLATQHAFFTDARARGIPVVGDIELFAQAAAAPIIAVTGSNGKTTVVTLLGEMLTAAGYVVDVCGNIGRPVLDTLQAPAPDFYVLELSSFQLETTYSLAPAAATLLNLSADHMDRYDTLSDYLKAKQRIFHHAHTVVLNADEPDTWAELALPAQQYTFGLSDADFHCVQGSLAYQNQILLPLDQMKLSGAHHTLNALAALALGYAVGVSLEKMTPVLKTFSGLSHRCEWVASAQGVTWFNDSKGTNVAASLAAIHALGDPHAKNLILIAGGDAKSADLTPLRDGVASHAKHVILLGRDAPRFEAILADVVPLTRVASLEEAVAFAARLAEAGDRVLLSPASASYDMFNGFAHRGQCFVEAVQKQIGSASHD